MYNDANEILMNECRWMNVDELSMAKFRVEHLLFYDHYLEEQKETIGFSAGYNCYCKDCGETVGVS